MRPWLSAPRRASPAGCIVSLLGPVDPQDFEFESLRDKATASCPSSTVSSSWSTLAALDADPTKGAAGHRPQVRDRHGPPGLHPGRRRPAWQSRVRAMPRTCCPVMVASAPGHGRRAAIRSRLRGRPGPPSSRLIRQALVDPGLRGGGLTWPTRRPSWPIRNMRLPGPAGRHRPVRPQSLRWARIWSTWARGCKPAMSVTDAGDRLGAPPGAPGAVRQLWPDLPWPGKDMTGGHPGRGLRRRLQPGHVRQRGPCACAGEGCPFWGGYACS